MGRIILCLLLAFSSLKAEEVLVENLLGIALYSDQSEVRPEGFLLSGVEVGDLQFSGISHLHETLQNLFIGKPLTLAKIEEIKTAVKKVYSTENHPVVAVDVPEQDMTEGVLQLVVTEGKIGEILFKGNKWFSAKRMEKYVRLKPGQEINSRVLSGDLFWINRSSFRRTDVVLTPGRLDGTTNLEFVTKDRFPLRPYAGGDNTGIDSTGKGRVFTGFNWGDAFYLDQTLSYQFTKSTEWNRFYAHTVNYNILLPWRNSITFYGGYSSVKPELPDKRFKNRGKSSQISMRYDVPLPSFHNFLHELTWGLDYKRTNTNMLFGEFPILIDGIAVITQAMLGYNLGYENSFAKVIFETEFFWSPGNLFDHQGLSAFRNLRVDATSHYVYSRSVLTSTFKLPKEAALAFIFRGQMANENLLSSEQYGLGGYNTVRGYDERIINGDNAFLASAELRMPTFSFVPLSRSKHLHDSWQLLGFFDYGIAVNHKTPDGSPASEFLMSVGPGIRYSCSTYAYVRFDYGFQLHHLSKEIEYRHSKYHFSAILSF